MTTWQRIHAETKARIAGTTPPEDLPAFLKIDVQYTGRAMADVLNRNTAARRAGDPATRDRADLDAIGLEHLARQVSELTTHVEEFIQ